MFFEGIDDSVRQLKDLINLLTARYKLRNKPISAAGILPILPNRQLRNTSG
jgi:hypothetical protein